MRKLVFVFLAIVLALSAVIAALSSGPAAANGYTISEYAICTNAAGQLYPAISGDIVVWMDYRNGNFDIYGARLTPLAAPAPGGGLGTGAGIGIGIGAVLAILLLVGGGMWIGRRSRTQQQ